MILILSLSFRPSARSCGLCQSAVNRTPWQDFHEISLLSGVDTTLYFLFIHGYIYQQPDVDSLIALNSFPLPHRTDLVI